MTNWQVEKNGKEFMSLKSNDELLEIIQNLNEEVTQLKAEIARLKWAAEVQD